MFCFISLEIFRKVFGEKVKCSTLVYFLFSANDFLRLHDPVFSKTVEQKKVTGLVLGKAIRFSRLGDSELFLLIVSIIKAENYLARLINLIECVSHTQSSV
jgi:hypothetical protein